jgi:hypothetical protein
MLTARRICIVVLAGAVGTLLALKSGSLAVRTIPTGAGFTVAVAQVPQEMNARSVAARIAGAGMPAFTRLTRGSYQVIAGPYVTLDEAEATQRLLRKNGFRPRLVVDESVRVRRRPASSAAVRQPDGAQVVLIAGAGSLAVVIELADEPRHVSTIEYKNRGLDVVIGPFDDRIAPVQWKAPSGVSLLRDVIIEQTTESGKRYLRARVRTAQSAQATLRTSGRRIYVDLASPVPLNLEELLAPTVLANTRRQVVEDYRATIAPVLARLESMEPFVMSAVSAPAGDVLAALERSLSALGDWAGQITPPGRWKQSHDAVLAAVRAAAESVSASFAGDRAGKAREAFELRDAATQALATVEDPTVP